MSLWYLLIAGLVGICFGSFGNVLIFRVPHGRAINGRSACQSCKRSLRWFELIPVLSYVVLLGRCRTCRAPISPQYPFVELSGAAIGVLAFVMAPSLVSAFFLGISLWLLLVLAVIDARTSMVPDLLSVPFIVSSVLWMILRNPQSTEPLLDLAASMVIGAGFFGLQWLVSRGRWIGSGDIFLAAGIGALLGRPFAVIVAIGVAYIIGALVASLLLLLRRRTLASQLAFGPFLAAGGFVTFLWGEELLKMLGI